MYGMYAKFHYVSKELASVKPNLRGLPHDEDHCGNAVDRTPDAR